MSLLGTPLDKITCEVLHNLIAAGIAESLYIEYKQETYGEREKDRAEFLADVSSFANTSGGDIVIGIEESQGVAVRVVPFMGNVDDEKRRLEQMALSNIEPRISNLRIEAIQVAEGGHVIIVRVPRSFIPPHRVTFRGSNRFWARAGSFKYEPQVEQLRQLFNDTPHIAERIRSFRNDRLVRITAGETPIPLNEGGKVVVHVVPLPSFVDGRLLDVFAATASGTHMPIPMDVLGGTNQLGVNLDGVFTFRETRGGNRKSYAQFFRSGAIEAVRDLSRNDDDGTPYFVGPDLTNDVVFGVRQYLEVLKSYETGLPAYIFLSFCGVEKCFYRYSPEGSGYWQKSKPLGREVIAFPEIVVDSFDVDAALVMRPVFNMLWNAFGFGQCDMYDGQGKWRGVG